MSEPRQSGRRQRLATAATMVFLAALLLVGLPWLIWWQMTAKFVRAWEQEKRPALAAAAEAAQPLIDALGRYRADHGRYPDELEALVPEYLGRVPAPQRPLRDPWWYGPLEEGREFYLFAHPPQNYYGVPIQAPTDAEQLVYQSDGRYEHDPWDLAAGARREREPLDRIGAWAYYAHSSTPPRRD